MVQQKGCKKALTPNKPELIEKTMQHTHTRTHTRTVTQKGRRQFFIGI